MFLEISRHYVNCKHDCVFSAVHIAEKFANIGCLARAGSEEGDIHFSVSDSKKHVLIFFRLINCCTTPTIYTFNHFELGTNTSVK